MDQFRYNTDIQNAPLSNAKTSPEATTLTPLEMTELLNVKEREIVNWRRFAAIPDQTRPGKKTLVGSHLCEAKQKNLDGNDELALLFDDKKVPVQVIAVPNPEINGRDQADYEVIGEKASHRLAQRPGSYVILKYVRPVIKRLDTQTISCPPAPVGVVDGSRADVSFITGMIVGKFAYPSHCTVSTPN